MSKNIVAIQLSTTFCRLAFINEFEEVEVFTFKDGKNRIPSFIAILEDQTVLVGQEAYNQYCFSDEELIEVLSRTKDFEDFFSTNIDDSPLVSVLRLNDEKPLKTKTFISHILQFMVEGFEQKYGPIDELMISIPDLFSDEQYKAVYVAAIELGLPLLEVVSESSAAITTYMNKYNDLAGFYILLNLDYETYTANLINFKRESDSLVEIETPTTVGFNDLGIRDFDFALLEDINDVRFEELEDFNIYLLKDVKEIEPLMVQAQEFRKILYVAPELKKSISSYYGEYYYEIDLETYSELIKPLVKRIHSSLIRLLSMSALKPNGVRRILIINENPQIKYLDEYFQNFFSLPPVVLDEGSEIIVRGLALECLNRARDK